MNALLLMAATVAVGIDIGWEPLDEGGYEYTIQIKPQQVQQLLDGQDLVSEVPPELQVRKYRIIVGSGKLPQTFGKPARVDREEVVDEPLRSTAGDLARAASESGGPALRAPGANTFNETSPADEPMDQEDRPREKAALEAALPRAFNPDPDTTGLLDKRSYGKSVAFDDDERRPRETEKPTLKFPDKSTDARHKATAETEVERPWWTLIATLIALFISLGANVYLGWVAWGARMRYRDLIEQVQLQDAEA